MEVKKFAVRKKQKKIEKRPKKSREPREPKEVREPRESRVTAASPSKRSTRPPAISEPKAFEAESERQHSELLARPREISMAPSEPDMANYSQISPSDFEENRGRSRLRDPFEGYGNIFHHINEAQSQDRQLSHQTENRYLFTSDINEEEGMEPIFHQEFRKVSRLDSPKMSISSSIRGRSVRGFFFHEDEPKRKEPNDLFTKMQKLCAPQPKGNLPFRLLPLAGDAFGGKGLLWNEDEGKSQQSQDVDFRFTKVPGRRSRKNSRKNSSVENLIL
jgi:hypothetical protein